MNSILACCRRIGVLVASLSVLMVSFVASVSAQDIAVTKFTESSVVAEDTDVTYQVIVSNSSGSTGPTTLTDTVPANMTFVSAVVPDGWDCGTLPAVGSGGTITCTFAADLPDESVFPFTFVFHVVPETPNGTVIINTASISNEADPNSANDTSSAMVTVGEPPPPPPPPLLPKDVLISEFRLSGPGGSEDDFIELYCNRDTDCDISGAFLRGHDPVNVGDFALTFPPQSIIPARHFLLVADSRGYTLFSYGFPDIDVALSQPPEPEPPFYFYDNEGIQLVSSGDPLIIDSVGFTGGGNDFLYVEGTGLQRASSRPADQYAYVRKRTLETNGLPQDTNNNAGDFVLVSVTGTAHPGITAPPVLGAPGPKGLSSPLTYSQSQVPGVLVDPAKSKEEDPNRVRVGTGDSGTLSIRRSFTNNTQDTFDYLSFRVIEITTLNSTSAFGSEAAQLRLVSSGSTSAEVPSRGGPVTINGTVLEYDPSCLCLEPQQPNGGGLNSTVFVNAEEFFMVPGDTVDVQFLLNVVKSGLYRFYVYVEAGFFRGGISELSAGPSRIRSKPTTTRKFISAKRLPAANAIKKSQPQTPVITPITTTSPGRLTVPVRNTPTPGTVRNAPTPRVIIINRGIAEGEKKPRKKTRVRRKNSAALKKKSEERFAAEKPQN
jgi:uncharacterized repeat protein (TIGR01451 family)